MTQPIALDSVLSPAGPFARHSSEISWVLIGGATIVFCIVLVLLLWVLLRRRSAATQPMDQRRARSWIVGGGVIFPLVVLSALLGYDIARTTPLTTTDRHAGAIVVSVKAHMWWWEVRYRDPATGGDIVVANQINLPVGRPMTVGLLSDDVIHSLWIPALGGKVDMVPGRVNQMTLLADRSGSFRGQCAEYCGDQHAKMGLQVIAQDSAGFERWLAGQAQPAAAPQDELARRGLQVFTEQRCHMCHAVRGLAEGGIDAGPDLTHLASRSQLGAVAMPLSETSLARWITDVQAVKPGARMPSYGHLDPASLRALVAFLMQLE